MVRLPALALALLLLLLAATPAAAVELTVNDPGDASDARPGDAICDADKDAAGNQCTLRAALQEGNVVSGEDTVRFALPGSATIAPQTALPSVTSPTILDGLSQPGQGWPRVTIDGSALPPVQHDSTDTVVDVNTPYGLRANGARLTVRGLRVHSFRGTTQIGFFDSGGSSVDASVVGLRPDGTPGPDQLVGVYLDHTENVTVGGPADGNVISGARVGVMASASVKPTVWNNRIGLDESGTQCRRNGDVGVMLTSNNGQANSGDVDAVVFGNTIACSEEGVYMRDQARPIMQRNLIGSDVDENVGALIGDGSFAVDYGVTVHGTSNNVNIGGPRDTNHGNVFAAARKTAVAVEGKVFAAFVLGNTIGMGADQDSRVDGRDHAYGGQQYGVIVQEAADGTPDYVRIGMEDSRYGNVIGNGEYGVGVYDDVTQAKILWNVVGRNEHLAPVALAHPNVKGIEVANTLSQPQERGPEVEIGTNTAPNLVSANTEVGIYAGRGDRVRILHNEVGSTVIGYERFANGSGIVVNGQHHVEYNHVVQARELGIGVGPTSEGATIVRNSIAHVQGTGILVHGAAGTDLVQNSVGWQPTEGNPGGGPIGGDGIALIDGARNTMVGTDEEKLPAQDEECFETCNHIENVEGDGVSVSGAGSDANVIRGNRMEGVRGEEVEIGEDGPETLDAGDADSGPNEGVNQPTVVQVTTNERLGRKQIAGRVELEDGGSGLVDIYETTTLSGDRPRNGRYVGTAKPRPETGVFTFLLPEAVEDHFVYARVTDWRGNTSESSPVCVDDTDGDGLCDGWERNGIDFDQDGTSDLRLPGATVGLRDLYVELDAMEGILGSGSHASRYGLAALRRVGRAFADAPDPVTLHWEGAPAGAGPGEAGMDETDLPRVAEIEPDERGPAEGDDLADYRRGAADKPCDGRFGTVAQRSAPDCFAILGAKDAAYRYVLAANKAADRGPLNRGVAVGGTMATLLGATTDAGHLALGGRKSSCGKVDVCRARNYASVLMHELGHSFGLGHTPPGDTGFGDNPNYLSVMNSAFQWDSYLPRRPLDFSREQLPDLREEALNEPAGLGATDASANWLYSLRFAHDAKSDMCLPVKIPVRGGVDWDGDGKADKDRVIASVNDPDAIPGDTEEACELDRNKLGVLSGWDDWAHMSYDQRLVVADRHDASSEEAEAMAQAADTDGDGVPSGEDVCTEVADPGQEDADGDAIGDACVPRIRERDLELALTGEASVPADQATTLKLTLRNDFPLPAGEARVAVALPEGLTVVSGSGTGSWAGGVWTVQGVPADGAVTFSLDVKAMAPGPLKVSAEVAAMDGLVDADSVPGNGDAREDDRAEHTLVATAKLTHLRVEDTSVREGTRSARTATFAIRVTEGWPAALEIPYATADDTARAGEDYEQRQGTVTIPAGSKAPVQVTVPVVSDRRTEPRERFALRVTAPDGVPVQRAEGYASIDDDDAAGTPGEVTYLQCVSQKADPVTACEQGSDMVSGVLDVERSPDGRFLYASGYGTSFSSAKVGVFAIEPGGTLADVECHTADRYDTKGTCTKIPHAANGVRQIELSPDGRFAYLWSTYVYAGLYYRDTLYVYRRDEETGKLTFRSCVGDERDGCTGGVLKVRAAGYTWGSAMHMTPDGRHVIVVPQGTTGGHDDAWQVLSRDPATGALSDSGCYRQSHPADDPGGQTGPCRRIQVAAGQWISSSLSADGRYLAQRSLDQLALAEVAANGDLAPGPRIFAGDREVPRAACPIEVSATRRCPPAVHPAVDRIGSVAFTADGMLHTMSRDRNVAASFRLRDGAFHMVGCAQDADGPEAQRLAGCAQLAELDSGEHLVADGDALYLLSRGGGVVAITRGPDGAITDARCADPEMGVVTCSAGVSYDEFTGVAIASSLDGAVLFAPMRARNGSGPKHDGVGRFLRHTPGGSTNRAPVCSGGALSGRMNRDLALTLRCADPDQEDTARIEIVEQPAQGSLVGLDPVTGSVAYHPRGGWRGTDRIRFRASDGRLSSPVAEVTVRIDELAPVCATQTGPFEVRSDRPFEFRVQCRDPEGDAVALRLDGEPTSGRAKLAGDVVTYQPVKEHAGRVTIDVVASDGARTETRVRYVLDQWRVPDPPPAGNGNGNGPGTGGGGRPTGGGSSCRGSSCEVDRGGTLTFTYFCDGRQVSSAGTCQGTLMVCTSTGRCTTSNPTGSGAVAAVRGARRAAVLGQARFRARPGQPANVKLKLNRRGLKALRRKGRLSVQLVWLTRLRGGKVDRRVTRVTLKAPKAGRTARG